MERSERLGLEKTSKLLVRFSIPAIIGMIVQAFYNVISRIFIGNSVGSLGIAGITVAFPVMMLQLAFGFMIGMGATTLVSIRLGERKKEEAELVVGNTIILLIILSLLITVIGLMFMDPMLRLFGASDVVLPYARDYLGIILLGTILGMTGFGMNNFLRAEGNPNKAMVTMLIGSIINIILAPIFIGVFHWGMKGAAIATIISQTVSAIWIVSHFALGKGELKVRKKNLRLDPQIISRIIYLGLSPFAMMFSQSLLGGLMNISLKTYGGDLAISGMGVVTTLMSLIMMPIMGISSGAQPLIGYNFGAKKYDRVKEVLKYSVMATTAIATFGFVITRMFPTQLIAIFNSQDAQLIEFGSRALLIFLLLLPIVGFQIIGAGYFQAVGKPIHATVLGMSRQVLVFIPALLILPRFFGLDGVFIAGPVSDLISTTLTGVFLFLEIKHLDRKQLERLCA